MIDTEAPVITCPADQTIGTYNGQSTASPEWEKPAAVDNSGHDPNVTCTPTSGTTFAIGTTYVECEATDEARNRDSCVFGITVEGSLFRSALFLFHLFYCCF